MNCPQCQSDLVTLPTTESAQVDVCPRGHGVWFDAGEIDLFVENYQGLRSALEGSGRVAVAAKTAPPAFSAGNCPRCGVMMDTEIVSGAPISACPSCKGWWLVQGSLARLKEAFSGAGARVLTNEASLYARAATKASAPPDGHAAVRAPSPTRTGEILFWTIVFGFGLLLSALIVMENVRHLSSNAQLVHDPDRLFVYLLAGLAGGVALFVYGFVVNRRKRLIESTPTSAIRSLALGLVEVNGSAEPDGGPLTAPFSGTACVFYSYKVEEERRSGKNSRWVTIAKGTSDQPFFVRDPTGRVLVTPRDARLEMADDRTYKNNWMGTLPPEAITGLARLGISTDGWFGGSRTLRCRETCLFPGETVYVLGTAQENPAAGLDADNAGRIYIGPGRDGDFIVSDRSEKDLLRSLRWRVFGSLIGGPAMTLACLLILLKRYLDV